MGGAPKSSILLGFFIINHPAVYPHDRNGNPQIQALQATSSAVGIAPGFVDRTAPRKIA